MKTQSPRQMLQPATIVIIITSILNLVMTRVTTNLSLQFILQASHGRGRTRKHGDSKP